MEGLAERGPATAARGVIASSADHDLQDIVDLLRVSLDAAVAALTVLDDGVYHYDVVSGAPAFASPAELALCRLATGTGGLFELHDTSQDPRTRGLPAVDGRAGAVRYYLSAPLMVAGVEIGRLCLFDVRPRSLDERESRMLTVLADAAGKLIEHRLFTEEDSLSGRSADVTVARAAHELRSPLVTLGATLGLLEDLLVPTPGSAEALMVGKAQSAVVRLGDLVTAVLDLDSVGQSSAPTDLDLARVIEDVVADLGEQLRATAAVVEVGALPRVHADPFLVHSVLLNLVGNALKFTRSGETPRVRIECDEGDRVWTVRIRDEGIGVPEADRERVLDPFVRLTLTPGHGLGLSTVARIVERHGGRVGVSEGPDGLGTEVWFTLPRP